ncbi:MAG: hypothetical protein ABFE07_28565 [Armatimonadia bacterium]
MRWRLRRPGAEARARNVWRPWFAWHPVCVPSGKTYVVVWLETIEMHWVYDGYGAEWYAEFRLPLGEEARR